ncbi:unnamed protein product [Clonostachys rosea]|uniref:RING-type E3 ubiquitin transferase n=1 Tax=Bionectria ochroleuca TaxID=29856 RepID=A0ABY6UWL4_BIOOC|nr:unnamed protein product [Clonostachys rosea]
MGNVFAREAPQPQPQTYQPPPRPDRFFGTHGDFRTAPAPFRLPDWAVDAHLQFENEPQVLRTQTSTTVTQLPRRQCRFFAKGRCKKGEACTFLHESAKESEETKASKVDETLDDSTREFGGAWAEFGDGAATVRVSLPSDFSAIRISNLPNDCSVGSVTDLLKDVGLTISEHDVRITKHADSTKSTAVVKVRDPSFSKEACRKLGTCITLGDLEVASIAVPLPKGSHFRQVDCRQVQCSWHRPNRAVYLFFGNKEIAFRLQQKLRTGKVKVNGLQIKAHPPVPQKNQTGATSWMIKLTGLVETAKEEDIIQAIPKLDRPRRIEMGEMSYVADMELDSTLVQSMLYTFGPLERWEVSDTSKGMRVKAHATFLEDSHAQHAASALYGKPLPFCESNKLFVEIVTSVRFKVSTRVYDVVQQRINSHKSSWDRQYIRFFASPSRGFYRVLKLEGRDRESVAKAKQELDLILTGDVMKLDGKAILYPGFKISRDSYKRLKTVEEELGVVIIRDVRTCQFRVFGDEAHQALATEALDRLIKDITSAMHYIRLGREDQYLWAVNGGLKTLQSQLGRDKVVFDRKSRCIIVQGSESDFADAKLILASKSKSSGQRRNGVAECPICLSEADEPIRTSCNHTYCGLCFIDMCQAEASRPRDFCITCDGDSGECGQTFKLTEIRNLLLSETFEDILEASFQSFVQRHPDQLRYCPTPDCSQVYRVTSKMKKRPSTFTCEKCLASICTACHTSHPGVTCAQHQGDSSGDLQALDKVKKELGIQDCPRCEFSMEKTGGCNHMTCQRCSCHICWVCLATFDQASACYDHMRKLHGNIGI